MGDSAPPALQGESVILRPAAEHELDGFAARLASDSATAPWFGTDPEVIVRWLEADTVSVFAIEVQGETVGVMTYEEEPDPDYRAAGIDIGLFSHATGSGFGPDALRTLAAWLIDERGHHRITIDPAVANERAIRAYEKVGFRPVGVMRQYERGPDGTWHDNLLMDLLAPELVRHEPG